MIRALDLQGGSSQGSSGLTQGMAAFPAEAPGGSGNAFRPAALARLLAIAPQTVPFAQRVEIFRALIAADHTRSVTQTLTILEDRVHCTYILYMPIAQLSAYVYCSCKFIIQGLVPKTA